METLVHSYKNDPAAVFVEKIQAIFNEFPESKLSCRMDLVSGGTAIKHKLTLPLNVRFLMILQSGKKIGYLTLLAEYEATDPEKVYDEYLVITGSEKLAIPVTEHGTAMITKAIKIRFREMLKTMIITKYTDPESLDNVGKCKILATEIEKLMFRIV